MLIRHQGAFRISQPTSLRYSCLTAYIPATEQLQEITQTFCRSPQKRVTALLHALYRNSFFKKLFLYNPLIFGLFPNQNSELNAFLTVLIGQTRLKS
jgi:hypothetical protein